MTMRRIISVASAAALVLAGCAGATGDTTAVDTAAAPADDVGATDVDDDDAVDDGTAEDADRTASSSDETTAGGEAADEGVDGHGDDAHVDDGDTEAHAQDDHDDSAATTDVDRVVEIDMEDIAFSVTELEFSVGERVRFVFENVGEAPHEAIIGDMHVQQEHEAEMAEGGGHHDGGHHGDLSMISLESGESGSFVHEFTEAGELWMGCHVPGHWDAGMSTRITVTS